MDAILPSLYDALAGGRYALAVSIGITIAVWLARTAGFASKRSAPWIAAALGVLAGVGGALATSEPADVRGWLAAIEQGFRTGGGAALVWTLVGKRIDRHGGALAESAEAAARRRERVMTPAPSSGARRARLGRIWYVVGDDGKVALDVPDAGEAGFGKAAL